MLGLPLGQLLAMVVQYNPVITLPVATYKAVPALEMGRFQRDLNITPEAATGIAANITAEGATTATGIGKPNGGRGLASGQKPEGNSLKLGHRLKDWTRVHTRRNSNSWCRTSNRTTAKCISSFRTRISVPQMRPNCIMKTTNIQPIWPVTRWRRSAGSDADALAWISQTRVVHRG
jgi:hypothetical protein